MHEIRSISIRMVISLIVVVFLISPRSRADDLDSQQHAMEETDGFRRANSAVVFDRTRVTLDGEGGRRTSRELMYKTTSRATGGMENPTLRFDAGRDTLIVETARWKATDGEWNDLDTRDIFVSTIPEAQWASAYARLKEVQVSFPAVRAESAVYLRYRIEPNAARARGAASHDSDVILFGGRDSIGEMSYEIAIAAGSEIHYEMLNDTFDPEIISGDSGIIYRWSRTDLPPIPRGLHTADLSYIVPRLCWTTCPDWEALGLEISERFWESVEASQQAVEGWSRITSLEIWGIPALMNAARFVTQRVRSVQIAPPEIGYTPLAADRIWENLYANSLDKAVLLTAIARAYGYDAIPVLVPGEPGPFSPLPVLEQFHHVIVAIPTGDDTLWLDPMAQFHPPGMLPAADSYGMGCMMVGGAPLLLPVPLGVQETQTEFHVSLNRNGDLEGTQTYLPQGDFAAESRAELAGLSSEGLDRFAQSALSRWDGEARLMNFRVSNAADLTEPVTMEFRFERSNYATLSQQRMTAAIPPSPFDPVREDLASLPSEINYPVTLRPCCSIRIYTLTIPDGWRAASLPPTLLMDNPFLRIEIITRLRETVLTWVETTEIKRDLVPVADYSTLYESYRTSMQQQYQQIILETE